MGDPKNSIASRTFRWPSQRADQGFRQGLESVHGRDGHGVADENLAAVLTYIRGSWGIKPAVTADDIKKIRAEIGNSPQPLSGAQLQALPE